MEADASRPALNLADDRRLCGEHQIDEAVRLGRQPTLNAANTWPLVTSVAPNDVEPGAEVVTGPADKDRRALTRRDRQRTRPRSWRPQWDLSSALRFSGRSITNSSSGPLRRTRSPSADR